MKYLELFTLLCLMLSGADNPAPPAGKGVKDVKGSCQIWVPENWTLSDENTGSAVLQDASNAIAVVTSQPGQAFKPLTESMQRLMRIPKDKLFEKFRQADLLSGQDCPEFDGHERVQHHGAWKERYLQCASSFSPQRF